MPFPEMPSQFFPLGMMEIEAVEFDDEFSVMVQNCKVPESIQQILIGSNIHHRLSSPLPLPMIQLWKISFFYWEHCMMTLQTGHHPLKPLQFATYIIAACNRSSTQKDRQLLQFRTQLIMRTLQG